MSENEISFLNPPEERVARFAVLAAQTDLSTFGQPITATICGG